MWSLMFGRMRRGEDDRREQKKTARQPKAAEPLCYALSSELLSVSLS